MSIAHRSGRLAVLRLKLCLYLREREGWEGGEGVGGDDAREGTENLAFVGGRNDSALALAQISSRRNL